MDKKIADIPEEEENANMHKEPIWWKRIDDFVTSDAAISNTNFNKAQLQRFLELFGLPEIVRQKVMADISNSIVKSFLFTL